MKDRKKRPEITITDISDTFKSKAEQVADSQSSSVFASPPPAIAYHIAKNALENSKKKDAIKHQGD
jgi:hypothetical protein